MEFSKRALTAALAASLVSASGCGVPQYRDRAWDGVRYSNGSFDRYGGDSRISDTRANDTSPEAFLSYLERSDPRYGRLSPEERSLMASQIRLMEEETALAREQRQALKDLQWQQAGQSFLDFANTVKRGSGELSGSFQGAFNQVSPTIPRITAGAFSVSQLQLLNQYQVWLTEQTRIGNR